MKIHEIRKRPTSVWVIPPGTTGVHESVLRAWQIVEKVKDLLGQGTPPAVVLEIIEEMERRDD